jgi:hypothetical protein
MMDRKLAFPIKQEKGGLLAAASHLKFLGF